MKLVANRFELFNAMINRKYVIFNIGGIDYNCYVNGMDMEDGSGYSFNVHLYIPSVRDSERHQTIYVKCN